LYCLQSGLPPSSSEEGGYGRHPDAYDLVLEMEPGPVTPPPPPAVRPARPPGSPQAGPSRLWQAGPNDDEDYGGDSSTDIDVDQETEDEGGFYIPDQQPQQQQDRTLEDLLLTASIARSTHGAELSLFEETHNSQLVEMKANFELAKGRLDTLLEAAVLERSVKVRVKMQLLVKRK
jgi:hypothetical protein